MIFKNAMSYKAKIKQLAKEKGVSAQQVQQNYLIEIFLEKIAASKYKDNFIIKGGYLIGSLIGLDLRATMNLDATIKGFELTPEKLLEIAHQIVNIPTEVSFKLSVIGVEEIRETDDYPGFKLKLAADFERIHEIITIDVTTGDAITPKEIDFRFRRLFDDQRIELWSYPVENVLAEKLETILSRGVATTRPRDFYDVFILSKMKADQIDYTILATALINTKNKRGSVFDIKQSLEILTEISLSEFQQKLWTNYQSQYHYAADISHKTVLKAVCEFVAIII
ncbi:nucleotidyl transferase AbiEii/AbiGii toxin family protein [Enterococcus hulanensis]|uniref:nucleotidyl transferase AbiEii/AbiGii toxin family protein n=1 Tax=Enterococcus hulanensis TaxID=2559929 RepID=UPI0028900C20|nr:nucleotidyl transferase AbiEii/AbiGii toxin family protein [Enterococcus hulanensis]MDT2660265.1 nucleotidyl transferase AbiEii/AbiGii toxin family protein [Enterococcus hulanensis]